MSTSLHLVYQYRQLAGKNAIAGLDMGEIELIETIESLFAEHNSDCRRNSAREEVSLKGELRLRGHRDPVVIENLSLGGMTCHGAPYAEVGDTVEIVIEDEELNVSYRYKATVRWVTDTDPTCSLGLRFVGAPLMLRHPSPEDLFVEPPVRKGRDTTTVVDADEDTSEDSGVVAA